VCFAFALATFAIAATGIGYAARMGLRWWLAVYAGFALSLVAAWLGVWTLGGRNPLGRRPERVWTQRPRRLLLARAALGWAVLTCSYILFAIPFPLRGGDRATVGLLAVTLAGAGYAAIPVARAHGARARVLTVWLGAWAAVMLGLAALRLPGTVPGDPDPAMMLAMIIAGSLWIALLVAGLLVWSVRGAWHPPASGKRPSLHVAEPCGES
jgi:hypothetical protein